MRLAAYGQWLYDRGGALLEFSEVINALVDLVPLWRGQLNEAWAVAWAWKAVTGANNHRPCPALVVQAFAAVLLDLRRPVQAFALLLGFAALLRPIELARLLLSDVLMPEELGVDLPVLFVRIQNPKKPALGSTTRARPHRPTRLVGARRVKTTWPTEAPLFGSYQMLVSEWRALCG